jgi:uncharacterized membrane protein YkvA (DUF1232 family)
MKFSIQSLYTWYRNLLRHPQYRWWVIIGTLIYFVSPFDIAPDFLPFLGEVDDIMLLTLLVSEVSGLVIEGFKARRASVDSKAASTAEDYSTSNANTIDVDAVSVK